MKINKSKKISSYKLNYLILIYRIKKNKHLMIKMKMDKKNNKMITSHSKVNNNNNNKIKIINSN